MRICAYVQGEYAKQTYSNECFNVRQWVGLSVIIDALRRAGYPVEFAGLATVHEYDVILVSITSDCDWWGYIAERERWRAGRYLVVVGGAGVLNVRPFLRWADAFVLGRGEDIAVGIVSEHARGGRYESPSVIWADDFNPSRRYQIAQTPPYPHPVRLENGKTYREQTMGCPHKCLFCGYTWQRKYYGKGAFKGVSGLWSGAEVEQEQEAALIDMHRAGEYNLKHLLITAIDGSSERLRMMVNKRITSHMLTELLEVMAAHDKPHQLKIYNILGYPTETHDDWREFAELLATVDGRMSKRKQWSILLHNTPFRPMPATPAACWPAHYGNLRGEYARVVGGGKYKGNIFYQGNAFWAVEGMGCDSLPTHTLSMICHRGTEQDADNIRRIAASPKFWRASTAVRQATLERYFDVGRLFGALSPDELPTKYLQTYCGIERMWGRDIPAIQKRYHQEDDGPRHLQAGV